MTAKKNWKGIKGPQAPPPPTQHTHTRTHTPGAALGAVGQATTPLQLHLRSSWEGDDKVLNPSPSSLSGRRCVRQPPPPSRAPHGCGPGHGGVPHLRPSCLFPTLDLTNDPTRGVSPWCPSGNPPPPAPSPPPSVKGEACQESAEKCHGRF